MHRPCCPGLARLSAVLGLSLLALLVALAVPARSQDDEKKKDDDRKEAKATKAEVAKIIDQLGDDDVDVRKKAEKELVKQGEGVLPAIRKAARDHTDPDVRLRCIVLSTTLIKKLYGEVRKYTGHTGAIRHIAVSKDGKRILTGGMDNVVCLWDVEKEKPVQKMTGHTSWAWQVAFSPDEKKAISSGGMDKSLRLWDLSDGSELKKFEGHTARAYGAAFAPNGKHVASGGAGDDCTVRLWDAKTAKEVKKLTGHTGWVWKVVYSPDGKKLASAGCNDYSFRVWDVEDPDEAKELFVVNKAHEDGFVVGIAFSPDNKHVLTSGRDTTVKLWSATDGKLVRTYTGMADNVEAVAFSKDGKRFLAGENKIVHVFDTESGKIIHRFEEHPDIVYAVAFLPNGQALSAGAGGAGNDFTMRLWNVPK
jgi:WD40 repeat protein